MRNLRKTLALVLSVIMLFSCMAVGMVSSAAGYEGPYTYYVENGEAIIVDAQSGALVGDVVIPSKLGGYPVTAIADYAFEYCEYMTSVVIPDSVKSVGYEAFGSCYLLKSFDTGDGVKEFSAEVLDAYSLEELHLGKNVRITADDAYNFFDNKDCYDTLNTVTVADDNPYLDVIDGVLYGENKTLLLYYPLNSDNYEYVMPAEVKGVFYPLYLAKNIEHISYNAKFSMMDDYAEDYAMLEALDELGMDSLLMTELISYIIPVNAVGISVNASHPYLKSAENVLYNKDGSILLRYAPQRVDTSFEIGEDVVWLGMEAFSGARNLELTISDGFTENLNEFLKKNSAKVDLSVAMEKFLSSSAAKSFTVADTNEYLATENGVLYNKEMTDLVKYPIDSYGDYYELPETVRFENLVNPDGWETGAFASLAGATLSFYPEYISASDLTVHVSDATFEIFELTNTEDAYEVIAAAFLGVEKVCTDSETIDLKAYNKVIDELIEIVEAAEADLEEKSEMLEVLKALKNDLEDESVSTKQAIINYAENAVKTGAVDREEADEFLASIESLTEEEFEEMGSLMYAVISETIHSLEEELSNPEITVQMDLMKALCVKMEACEGEHLYDVVWRNAPASIKAPSVQEIKHGEILILHAEYTAIPEGTKLVWTVTGEGVEIVPSEDGTTCAVISVDKGTATVKLSVVAENGTTVKDQNGAELGSEQVIKSNSNLWLKIVSFFKNLFRMNRTIEQSITIR